MQRNLISNGNFESGNLKPWTLIPAGGSAKVVMHKDSYRAEIRVGKHEALRLETPLFRAGSVTFDLSLQAAMPELETQKTADPLQDPPFMSCTLIAWGASQPLPIYVLPIIFWLSKPQKLYEHHGTMPPGVEKVQLIIAFQSRLEPELVGPIYLDNVKYKANLPE